ncbi:N-6 DNA methylase [Serratia plymuthica]|uniref:N-6 DNA methylase n=1 Tax=Serratia plymuthica TaxID=82996 RepID=UPI0009BED5F2|nr:N-6 DNA methylase [Serratia plymuthica]
MNQLTKHNESLRQVIASSNESLRTQLIDLDGLDIVMRECLSIEDMREAGSFFTGLNLATKVIEQFDRPINLNSVVLDPTCGAGNLLIVCSRQLKVDKSLTQTLSLWGKVLWGFDIYESFIEAAKLRIIIEAINRGAHNDCNLDTAFKLLKNIKVQDALTITSNELATVTHAVMNPPFTIWPSPRVNYWKSGKVNAAGVVFDLYLRLLPYECAISAILPDVLRSGSRYEGFRKYLSENMCGECLVWGRFNKKTDVDVFIISGIISSNNKNIKWFQDIGEYQRLSSLFDVRIGPLVAYRDIEDGSEYPYFHPKNSPAWKTVSTATEKRKFKGVVLRPPFIVVKRTSSPSDRYRASATIINLNEYVAIENHMIVIKPKNSTLKDCKLLLKILKSESTNEFLNQRIRVRHLTVGVIKDIPICKE